MGTPQRRMRQSVDENGATSVANIMQGKFFLSSGLLDHAGAKVQAVRGRQEYNEGNKRTLAGLPYTMVESLLQFHFHDQRSVLPSASYGPQALDETTRRPLIESTMKYDYAKKAEVAAARHRQKYLQALAEARSSFVDKNKQAARRGHVRPRSVIALRPGTLQPEKTRDSEGFIPLPGRKTEYTRWSNPRVSPHSDVEQSMTPGTGWGVNRGLTAAVRSKHARTLKDVQEIARVESERRLNASRMADASSHLGLSHLSVDRHRKLPVNRAPSRYV